MKPAFLKRVFAILLTGVLILSLAGCAGTSQDNENSDSSESDSGTTELTFWYSLGGAAQEANKTLTQQFNDTIGKEKGIHVTAEY